MSSYLLSQRKICKPPKLSRLERKREREREKIAGLPPIARGKGQTEACKSLDLDIFGKQVIQRGQSGLLKVSQPFFFSAQDTTIRAFCVSKIIPVGVSIWNTAHVYFCQMKRSLWSVFLCFRFLAVTSCLSFWMVYNLSLISKYTFQFHFNFCMWLLSLVSSVQPFLCSNSVMQICVLRLFGFVLIIPNLSAFQGTEGGVESVQRHSCWQNGLFCADFWLEREMGTCGTHRPFAQAQEQVCLFMRLTTVLNADMQVKHSLYILLKMSLPAVSRIDNVQNTRQCRYAICHCASVNMSIRKNWIWQTLHIFATSSQI